MNTVAAILADRRVATLFAALEGGEETRIAGGAVRDALLGKLAAEMDFATTALPEEVTRRAEAAGLKVVPTGIAHGTVTIVIEGRPFEVTTLRRDVDTDGRHAVVSFGRDWAEDAQRRDFTINGLYLDRNGRVHDFVGGEADLKAGRVRFIGDARTRIREDYLRILRFFRFFAGYGHDAPDPDAFSAVITERDGLGRLSRERVRAELLKLLVAKRAPEAVRLMAETGLLGMVLAGVGRVTRLARLVEIETVLGEADALRRLGALALFVPDDVERLRERLRLSNGEEARLLKLAGRTPRIGVDLDDGERKAAIYRLGPAAFRDRALLAWAESGAAAGDPAWRDVLALPETWSAPRFPVTGDDIAAWGVPKGPAVGEALRTLEERWIAAGFPEDQGWGRAEFTRSSPRP